MDRTALVRLGYVLVGLVVLWAGYTLLAPKDMFRTVGRVVLPWADIGPPTRTTIDEVTPGHVQAFRGQQVSVQARVAGLPEEGRVTLYYTTADRQVVDRPVEMRRSVSDYRHAATLPSGDGALQQSLSYRIEAGDAVTPTYTVEVVAAPTIVVQAVVYDYPSYTGLLSQRVERQGDIKAIEGTRVTLEALANQEIQAAHVDFDCNQTLDLRMTHESQTARGAFTLLMADDRQAPAHRSYQVLFKSARGAQNLEPVRHRIDVTRDVAPEIQIVAPRDEEIALPLDAALDVEVVAADPDFALASVTLLAAQDTKQVLEAALLDKPWRGQFVRKHRLQPRQLGLKAGDVVEYWAAAVDNKHPQPNRGETKRRRIRIVSPRGAPGRDDRLAQNDRRDGTRADAETPDDPRQPDGDDRAAADNHADDKADNAGTGEEQPRQPAGESGEPRPSADREERRGQAPVDSQQGRGGPAQAENGQPGNGTSSDAAGDEPQRGASGQERPAKDRASPDPSGEPGTDESPVANDGTDDGEAIERILKHRQANGPSDSKPSDSEPSGNERSPAGDQDAARGGDQGRATTADETSQGDASSARSRQGTQDSGPQQGGQAGDGANQPSGQDGAQPPSQSRAGEQGSSGKQGSGQRPSGGMPEKREPAAAPDPSASDGQSAAPGTRSGEKPAGDPNQPHKRGAGEAAPNEGQSGEDAGPRQSGAEKSAAADERPADGATDADSPREPTTGQGGRAQDDPTAGSESKPRPDANQRPDARGGSGDQQQGESGAGQKSNETQGAPGPNATAKPTRKSSTPSADNEQQPDDQAQSPSTSERESDSQGQEDGSRSGGGQRGGGQKANKSGTGGAGQNTAADEGAGQSDDAGAGQTSDRAGADRPASNAGGKSGRQAAAGSQSRPDGEDQRPGGNDAAQQPTGGANSSGTGAGSAQGTQASDTKPGEHPGAVNREQAWEPGADKADEANLDYARQATDLALEHLKDQLRRDQPDQALLERLGWTRDDVQKFVERWEAMRNQADEPGAGGAVRRELDDTLRSLGLRPKATALSASAARDDGSAGYRESHRTTPPAEYSEAFKAYTQGTARGGK